MVTMEPLRKAAFPNWPEKGRAKVIGDKILEKERNREFEISRNDRFRYRTRYFTDSGIIGSKEFVFSNYQRFKHLILLKTRKKAKSRQGVIRSVFFEATVWSYLKRIILPIVAISGRLYACLIILKTLRNLFPSSRCFSSWDLKYSSRKN